MYPKFRLFMSVPFRKRTQHQQDMAWIWLTKKKSSNEIFFVSEDPRPNLKNFLKHYLLHKLRNSLGTSCYLSWVMSRFPLKQVQDNTWFTQKSVWSEIFAFKLFVKKPSAERGYVAPIWVECSRYWNLFHSCGIQLQSTFN